MVVGQVWRRAREVGTQFKLKAAGVLVCEAIESRVLLSAAVFASPQSATVTGARAPRVAAPFHGSGIPTDLAMATAMAVQILDGHSNGTFSVGSSIPFEGNPASETPFLVGDFSGGGTDDIVLISHDTGSDEASLAYETSNGDGTFTAGAMVSLANNDHGFTPISGAAGDLNGDGKADLAIVGKASVGSQLVLAIGTSTGNGIFAESADYPIAGSNPAGTLSNEQVLIDSAGNIIVYDGSAGNLDVFSHAAGGTFTQQTPIPLTANLISLTTIAGAENLVVANGNQISLLVSGGGGNFQAGSQAPITLGGAISALTTGDFNLDGNEDIVTNQGILFGNGDGTFDATPQALPASTSTAAATLQTPCRRWIFLAMASRALSVSRRLEMPSFRPSITRPPSFHSICNRATTPPIPERTCSLRRGYRRSILNVTLTPTGNVTFFDGSTLLGTMALSGGATTFDAGSNLAGEGNSITVQYSGDASFAAGTSSPLIQTVRVPSITTVVSSENPGLAGDDIVFTAMVSGNDGAGDVPSGNVEFFADGTDLGGGSLDSTGKATFESIGNLAAGAHSITAQYQSDDNFLGSVSSALTQTIDQPALVPAIAATKLPTVIVLGTPVHGKVTVSLTNKTSSDVAAESITLFIASNGAIDNAAPPASKAFKHGFHVRAGQTKNLILAVNALPASVAAGTYKLLALVGSSVPQNSNTSPGPSVSVAAPFVEFDAGGAIFAKPNPVRVAKLATLVVPLVNRGNITSSTVALDIGLSDTGDTPATTDLETLSVHTRVKPGHVIILHLHVKIPTTVTPGAYHAVVSITVGSATTSVVGGAFVIAT